MAKYFGIILTFIFFLMQNANAAHVYPERYYQNEWCTKWGGRQEVRLPDSTRIDCLTNTYATEFDFAPKWAEAIGQSLHYAEMTGKKPAIILIIEKPEDFKYYKRIEPLCKKYGISSGYMEIPQNPSYTNIVSLEDIINLLITYLKQLVAMLL